MKKESVGPVLDAILTRVKKTTNDKVDICREFIKDKINEQQAKAACIVTLTPEASDIVSEYAKSLELPKDNAASMIIKLYSQDQQKSIKEQATNKSNTFTLKPNTMEYLTELSAKYGMNLDYTLHLAVFQQLQALNESNKPEFENSTEMNKLFNPYGKAEEQEYTGESRPFTSPQGQSSSDEVNNTLQLTPQDSIEEGDFKEEDDFKKDSDLIQNLISTCSAYAHIEDTDIKYDGDVAVDSYSDLPKSELVPMIIKCIKNELSSEEIKDLLKLDDEYFVSLMSEINNLSDEEIENYGMDEELSQGSQGENNPYEETIQDTPTLSLRDKLKAQLIISLREGDDYSTTLKKLNISDAELIGLNSEVTAMSTAEQNVLLEEYTS